MNPILSNTSGFFAIGKRVTMDIKLHDSCKLVASIQFEIPSSEINHLAYEICEAWDDQVPGFLMRVSEHFGFSDEHEQASARAYCQMFMDTTISSSNTENHVDQFEAILRLLTKFNFNQALIG